MLAHFSLIARVLHETDKKGKMKATMRNAIVISFLAMLACMSGCASVKQERLTVGDGKRVIYECAKGQRIVATYYSLSDGSLEFVKVSLPDGKERTLPHVVSASGARYTDDSNLVWWTKGDTAFVETRTEHGEWQISYRDCRAILETKRIADPDAATVPSEAASSTPSDVR